MRNFAAALCGDKDYLQIFIGDISPDATPTLTAQRLATCYPDFWPVKEALVTSQHTYDDWHIIEDKHNKIILNCPHGHYPNHFPSHAHGDISSFVWLYEQQPILIDSGRARYTKDDISILQKSAIGHNVSLVNDLAPLCESFVISGNWWPMPYARADITVTIPEKNIISIRHNGFKRATPVKEYAREIIINADIQVSESFQGIGKAKITTLWQFHPRFFAFDAQQLEIKNNDQIIAINFHAANIIPKINYYFTRQKTGWYSSQYGAAEPNPLLVVTWIVDLPFKVTTIFRIKKCVG